MVVFSKRFSGLGTVSCPVDLLPFATDGTIRGQGTLEDMHRVTVPSIPVTNYGTRAGAGIDNTGAFTAMEADSKTGCFYLPAGIYDVPAGMTLKKRYYGAGQLRINGVVKAPDYVRHEWTAAERDAAAPPNLGLDSVFAGDYSRCASAVYKHVTGPDTVGTPATGYLYNPQTAAHFTGFVNESGYSHVEGSGAETVMSRTGICAHQTWVHQAGAGDAVAYNAMVTVAGQDIGNTTWIGNPAGVIINGSMGCGADHVYLNPVEYDLNDDGFDVCCTGHVVNMNRTNDTAAKMETWIAYRPQSWGTKPIDVIYSGQGQARIGLDLVMTSCTDAAITLKEGQLVSFAGVGSDNTYPIGFCTDTGNIHMGNVSGRLEVHHSNKVVLSLGADRQDYGANTGTPLRTGFDVDTVTLPELAARVAALILDLQAVRLVGVEV